MRTSDKGGHVGSGRNSPNPTNFSNKKSQGYLSSPGIPSRNSANSSEELKHKASSSNERKKGILTERQPGDEFAAISIKRTKKLKPKLLPVVNESLIDTVLLMKDCENSKKRELSSGPASEVPSEAKVPSVKRPASKARQAESSRGRSERRHSESKVYLIRSLGISEDKKCYCAESECDTGGVQERCCSYKLLCKLLEDLRTHQQHNRSQCIYF
eukprot:TRINITY_DN3985_c0_g4_i3.p1 TRINITY_DN3985_c0_g4~~TRINITY_DN3985_c0_g4_i3.p1  ORF type:complete len:214 (-),score=23.67 TRINITY_DN3985_c0_g4_i3:1312-1953(-)